MPEHQSMLGLFFLSKTKARTSHDHLCVVFKFCQRICEEAARGEVALDVALGEHGLGKIMLVLGLMVGLHDLEGLFQTRWFQ